MTMRKQLLITGLAAALLGGCDGVELDETATIDQSQVTVTGDLQVRLSRTLIAREGEEARDADRDGLDDVQEQELAVAFSPRLMFDSAENAKMYFEPVTLFQVRPVAYRMRTLTVRIQLVFLFGQDGGYGPSSWCPDDDHVGDNDSAWYELTSTNDGVDWRLTKVHLSIGPLEWPTNSQMSYSLRTHPLIYLSAGKHHEYFDQSYDGEDSLYSSIGCNDDVNGAMGGVNADLRMLEVRADIGNNVGEPELHPATTFLDELDTFYPGESVWGGDDFYEVGPNTDKILRYPKPRDVGHLAPPLSASWSPWTSEETDRFLPSACPNGQTVTAAACRGSYCDDVAMYCQASGLTGAAVSWTPWFTDGSAAQVCPGGFVTAVECKGRYCDDMRFECTRFEGVTPQSCTWTTSLSEENATLAWSGRSLAGARCSGSYCDNLSFYVCSR